MRFLLLCVPSCVSQLIQCSGADLLSRQIGQRIAPLHICSNECDYISKWLNHYPELGWMTMKAMTKNIWSVERSYFYFFAVQICEVWLGGFSGRFNPSLLETRGGLVASYTFQPDNIDDEMSSRAPSIFIGISHISRQFGCDLFFNAEYWLVVTSPGAVKTLRCLDIEWIQVKC